MLDEQSGMGKLVIWRQNRIGDVCDRKLGGTASGKFKLLELMTMELSTKGELEILSAQNS